MVKSRAGRDSVVSLAGWLLADIFLVLGVVWLGSQPFVQADSVSKSESQTRPTISRALNTKPKRIDIVVDAQGLRSGNPIARQKFYRELNRAGVLGLDRRGKVAGLVLTFAGGDSCSNQGVAEVTSRSINSLLRRWYPTFVTRGTVKKAYVDFSCKRVNKVKIEFYTFVN